MGRSRRACVPCSCSCGIERGSGGLNLGYCIGMDGVYRIPGEGVLNAVLTYFFNSLVLHEIYF